MRDLSVISIIGGGWSFSKVRHEDVPGEVIAVNDAAVHLSPMKEVYAAISMDRLWTENRWEWLQKRQALFYARPNALQNVNWRQPWVHRFDNDEKSTVMSPWQHTLNGTNSGMCALNLAYAFGAKTVFLFGFDMQRGPSGEPYWYPAYEWAPRGGTKDGRYETWVRQFADVARQFKAKGIRVFNVSERSRLAAFPTVHPQDLKSLVMGEYA